MAGSGEQEAVEAISDARAQWKIVKEQGPNKRLRTHRDRYIAHTLIEMSDEEKAVCNDAFELLKDTTYIVQKLLQGVLGKPVDFVKIREIKLRDADAFWSRATVGAEAAWREREVIDGGRDGRSK